MLTVFLSDSGGSVELPHAVECVDTEDPAIVAFLDSDGRCLARFRRADVTIYAPPNEVLTSDKGYTGNDEHRPMFISLQGAEVFS